MSVTKVNHVLIILLISLKAGYTQQKIAAPATMDQKVNSLLTKMTLDEKIGQLNLIVAGFDVTGPLISKNVEENIRKGLVGGVFNTFTPTAVRKLQELAVKESRLHIPMIFGYDVIHGHKTIFPVPLALASSWNMDLIEKSARIAATEATADGLNWVFSPMVDISRDPRWGRITEGAGEDPWLGAQVAKAMVKGYQGSNLKSNNTVMACVKHFALYGAAEAGRDYNTVDMSRLQMYQDFLPPYKAAIDAGAGSVMSSFNVVDGIPATGNKWLMTDLLRNEWGFKGLLVTDYAAINEMTAHGLGDLQEVSKLALKAGIDMDMVGEGFLTTLKKSLKEGKITKQEIDRACRRVLEAKYKLGLFDDPYAYCNEERAGKEIFTDENRQAACEIAEHTFVLLKNQGEVLPLKKSGTIAVIGPLADNQRDLLGSWSAAGDWRKVVSVVAGIRKITAGQANILVSKGANISDDTLLIKQLNANGAEINTDERSPERLLNEAVATAEQADVVVAVLGESSAMSGEAASRSDIGIPENQRVLLEALVRTGKPVVLVLMNGRPLKLGWENEHVNAILETWFGGTEAGTAIANVLFGKHNPSGKLTVTFPRNEGQIPLYYNHKNTGRPYNGNSLEKYKSRYLDSPNDPVYPFGYGLSYTSFRYGDLKLNKTRLVAEDILTVSVKVTNTGKYTGEETVQMYITDPVASISRSVQELKDFRKVMLQPGESQEITFTISVDDLRFYNSNLKYIWEPGEFIINIGIDSKNVKSAAVAWTK